jgi:hypothetical protein
MLRDRISFAGAAQNAQSIAGVRAAMMHGLSHISVSASAAVRPSARQPLRRL